MTFAKRVFLIAGIYGLIVLLPQYFLENQVGRDSPPPITHAEFFYGFLGTAVAFQVVFLIVARDPLRYRPMMIASVLEKAGFGLAAFVLFLQQRLSVLTLGFGAVDLLFGVLFILAYVRTATTATSSA
jgi:hypothetical protein